MMLFSKMAPCIIPSNGTRQGQEALQGQISFYEIVHHKLYMNILLSLYFLGIFFQLIFYQQHDSHMMIKQLTDNASVR